MDRARGGASVPVQEHYPSLYERAHARIAERERIGRRAAELLRDGETLIINSGSTTIQIARAPAWPDTRCTVITDSIPVAMTIGHGVPEVILCPGRYMPEESAAVRTETLGFTERFNVGRCGETGDFAARHDSAPSDRSTEIWPQGSRQRQRTRGPAIHRCRRQAKGGLAKGVVGTGVEVLVADPA